VSRSKSISQKELAERLGITTRHVRNLVFEGMPKDGEGPKATHPWPETRDWYNAYLRAQERKKEPEDDLKELRKRKFIAEVRMAEIEIDEAEGRLIPFDVHELRIGAICDRLRGVLMTVPSKFLSRIQVTRTDLEAQAVGEQIRDETLRALQGTSDDVDEEMPAVIQETE
jgi:phage terminase Nu1 subunit (DNA packaging protein)